MELGRTAFTHSFLDGILSLNRRLQTFLLDQLSAYLCSFVSCNFLCYKELPELQRTALQDELRHHGQSAWQDQLELEPVRLNNQTAWSQYQLELPSAWLNSLQITASKPVPDRTACSAAAFNSNSFSKLSFSNSSLSKTSLMTTSLMRTTSLIAISFRETSLRTRSRTSSFRNNNLQQFSFTTSSSPASSPRSTFHKAAFQETLLCNNQLLKAGAWEIASYKKHLSTRSSPRAAWTSSSQHSFWQIILQENSFDSNKPQQQQLVQAKLLPKDEEAEPCSFASHSFDQNNPNQLTADWACSSLLQICFRALSFRAQLCF